MAEYHVLENLSSFIHIKLSWDGGRNIKTDRLLEVLLYSFKWDGSVDCRQGYVKLQSCVCTTTLVFIKVDVEGARKVDRGVSQMIETEY